MICSSIVRFVYWGGSGCVIVLAAQTMIAKSLLPRPKLALQDALMRCKRDWTLGQLTGRSGPKCCSRLILTQPSFGDVFRDQAT